METSPQKYFQGNLESSEILIIDDNPVNLRVLSDMLTAIGVNVRAALNGNIALESAKIKPPHLILLDIRLPHIDGYEICRRLKSDSRTSDIPIIFISALDEPQEKIKAFEAGGLDYITKPFHEEEVIARVRTHLSLSYLHKKLEQKVESRTRQLEKANRGLRTILDINKILIKATDEKAFLDKVCDVIVKTGNYLSCWIGLKSNEDRNNLTIAGVSEAHQNKRIIKKLIDSCEKECSAIHAVQKKRRTLIKRDRKEVSGSLWFDPRLKINAGACLSVPLFIEDNVSGAITFYIDEAYQFDDNEMGFLDELAADIAYGIHSLRQGREYRKAQEDLVKSEQRYRMLFEKAFDAIFLIKFEASNTCKIIDANKKAAEMHGYGIDELIGKSMEMLTVPDENQRCPKRQEIMLKGEWLNEEIDHIRKDGTVFPTEISAGVIEIGDEQFVLSIFRDISERKQAQNERLRLETQLMQAQKMEAIATLASGIAHDFNNILFAISGYTELCIQYTDKNSLVGENLESIKKANNRAADLVRQILSISRQEETEKQALQPKLIIKEVLKLLRATLPSTTEIKISIKSDAYVMANATQLHQIAMNLCINAGHAMEQNGGVLSVSLSDILLEKSFTKQFLQLQPGRHVKFTVSDTGHGIAANLIDKIFDPYFTTKSKEKGTGLGLSVVRGIVESLKGAVSVESKKGQGCTFSVYLPVIENIQKGNVEPIYRSNRGNERILLVDDEVDLVNICSQMLNSLGYKVTTETSSRKALSVVRQKPDAFDIIVTDLTMPRMTGIQLAKAVIKFNPRIPIILLSGKACTLSEKEQQEAGIKGFIGKPLNLNKLVMEIRKLLDTLK